MSEQTRSAEVARIVRALAHIHGGLGVDVVERTYPRLGPAEPGTGYKEMRRSLIPGAEEALSLSADADEIVIRMRTPAPNAELRSELCRQLRSCLETAQISSDWEVRTRLSASENNSETFEVTVFNCNCSGAFA